MSKLELVKTRDGVAADKPFIYSTWLKALRYGNDWFNLIHQDTYYKTYHSVVERILSGAKVKVACLADDPDVILGYAVYREFHGYPVLDFVFVKSAWRGIGIAKSLVPQNVAAVTHLTKAGRSILSKHPSVIFNPFY